MSEHYPEGPVKSSAQNKFIKRMYRECLDCKYYPKEYICELNEDVKTSKICEKYVQKL